MIKPNPTSFSAPLIRPAQAADAPVVRDILLEAVRWLIGSGRPMWRDNEFAPGAIESEVAAQLFHLAELNGESAGVVRFQLEDPQFWPDFPPGQAAYVHRLAVRRKFAGAGVSTALLQWAVQHARALGRAYLRLDTEASRPRLRGVYERFGFAHHSDRQVGPYFVSRYEFRLDNI